VNPIPAFIVTGLALLGVGTGNHDWFVYAGVFALVIVLIDLAVELRR
jgi:hypothetical protein